MTPTIDHVDILRRSPKFLQWHKVNPQDDGDILGCYMMAEKHYTPDELAELWAVSTETIRSIFRDEPGGSEDRPNGHEA